MLDHDQPRPGYRIVSLARMIAGGRWRSEAMRAYDQPLLYWFVRGQGRISIQGVTRGWGAHNAVLLPPGTMHGFEVMGAIQGHALYLPDDPGLALPDLPIHLRIRDVRPQQELTAQIANIHAELARGEQTSPRALAHHGGLLSVWLEREAGPFWWGETDPAPAAESLVSAYAALLERDFRSGRGVSDYARDLGVTAAHLTRCCRQASGRSASRLLQDRVTYEARKLLHETRLPVKDVAAALGFNSAAYFTRAFQAQTGLTPTAFRKSV